MRRVLSALVLVLAAVGPAGAAGLLIPEDKKLPPLAMVHHRVSIGIDDQVAVTTIEQALRRPEKPECISAAAHRAKARASGSSGQTRP